MSAILEKAYKMRPIIEAAMASIEDKVASQAVELSPTLKQDSSLIKSGTRINWNGVLKRASVDLWDTIGNNPDNAPTLWEDILYKDGIRIIPETITAGTAFAKNELGWWEDKIYISLIDNNVWTPTTYAAGWQLKE